MTEETKIVSGTEWRKQREEGVVVELPGQKPVRLRPVSMQYLLAEGRIPDGLTALASKLITQSINMQDVATDAAQMAKDIVGLNKVICTACMVEPKIVNNPVADNEISYEHLSEEEVDFIVAWASKPMQTMETFRKRQTVSMENILSS